jgi:hydrophobic/amphiphilic exporter-1 (mainly G- bacteria), HAE1 family
MQWLARISVKRPVLATVLMLVILVLGTVAYKSLGLDFFPNADFPIVVVTTIQQGAAAQEIESDITDKIEGAVNTISGIDNLSSTSSEGISLVVIQFTLEKPVDVATQEVRDKLNQILPELPKGIDTPVVSKIDPGATPVLYLALRSKQPIRDTTEIADKLVRRKIETIDGVGEVSLVGGRKRQINVILDPVRLRAQSMTALDVQRVVSTQNLNIPGGTVETGPNNITLRIAARATTLDELGRMVVREQGGHPIRIEDVGRVEDGQEREESYAQYDDDPTVVLSVKKQSGKNTVAVVDAVMEKLAEVRGALPPGVSLDIVYDNSSSIRTSTSAVIEHLILGAAFAVIVVLMFLASGRSTIIAALAIPISIIGTFAVMSLLGFTLNFLTLLALALAVGLVIDDAIVVIENIVSYIEKKGMKPFPATIAATKNIGLAVLATTLALMSVFLPVSFMDGMIGRFLRSFGLTMAAAIAVSLFVSFTLTPMLGARWINRRAENAPPDRLTRIVEAFYRPIERGYLAALRFAMSRRWLVVLACAVALGATGPIAKRLSGGFTPPNDKAQFQVSIRVPEGTSVSETRLVAERVANDIKRQIPHVEHTLITVGDDNEKTANLAGIRVLLNDPKLRDVSQEALMNRARREVIAKLPNTLRASVTEVSDIAGVGTQTDITYAITGPDPTTLERVAVEATERLRKVPGAVDVDNSLIVGKPEAKVTIDRDRAADLGVQISDIAGTLQLFVGGLKASTFPDANEQYDIRIRGEERFRADPTALSILTVPSSKHGTVPLASVVTVTEATGPSTIKRVARARQITISANAAPGVGTSFVTAQLKAIGQELFPPGYHLAAQGRAKEEAKLTTQFTTAISLSVLFMYLVLAAQFESWLDPLVILLVLPLTVPFGFLSLLIAKESINLFSLLGLLVLIGVVQKNAVLQIDHTKQLRAEGKSRFDAIIEANRDRLRPILMTTLAFVAGMVPLIVAKGIGAGYSKAMAGIVVGGQSLSLLLTLLASPVIYSLVDDVTNFIRRHLPPSRPSEETGESELDGEVSKIQPGEVVP